MGVVILIRRAKYIPEAPAPRAPAPAPDIRLCETDNGREATGVPAGAEEQQQQKEKLEKVPLLHN